MQDISLEQIKKQFYQFENETITINTADAMTKLIEEKPEYLKQNFNKDQLIQNYTKLAAFYLEHGISQQQQDRKNYLEKVRKIFYRTDHININEKRSFLLKGYYYLFQNDFEKARDHFDNAYNQDKKIFSYMLGKGLIEFHRQNFQKAMEYFKYIYQNHRQKFPEVYFLLSICYFKMDDLDMSEQSLLIALKKKVSNKSTIYSTLAVIYLIKQKYEQHYQYLTLAFKEEISNKGKIEDLNLLIYLSEHYLYKNDLQKVDKISKIAIDRISSLPTIRAEDEYLDINPSIQELKSRVYYLQGILKHFQKTKEGYDQAEKFYRKSLFNYNKNFATQFALAQVLMFKKHYQESITCLEFIYKNNKSNWSQECYLLLPHLYMRMNNKKKTIETFEKAIKFFPNNIDLKIYYCTYLETFKIQQAYKIYQQIIPELENNNDIISCELLNNIAIVLTDQKKFKQAEKIFQKYEQFLSIQFNEEDPEKQTQEMIYNLNRSYFYYEQNLYHNAKIFLYKILQDHPQHYEALINLAKISFYEKNYEEMENYFNKALFIAQKCSQVVKPEIVIYNLLYFLIKQKAFSQANKILQSLKNSDQILYLNQAIVYYYFIVDNREKLKEAVEYIKASAQISHGILNKQPYNYYAANLVGSLLVERGRVEDGVYVFNELQDILPRKHQFIYNIALSEYMNKNYEKSLIILQSPKSSNQIRNTELYALVLTILGEFLQAESKWKFLLLKKPCLLRLYQLTSFFHEKGKKYFQKGTTNIQKLKLILKEIEYSFQTFQKIYQLIPSQDIKTLSREINNEQIEKRKLKLVKIQCDNQIFFLNQNRENYYKKIVEVEKRKLEQQESKIKRKEILLEKLKIEQEKQKQEEELKRKKEEEMELKAQQHMDKVQEFQMEWGVKQVKEKDKNKNQDGLEQQKKSKKSGQDFVKKRKHQLTSGDQQLNLQDNTDSNESSDEEFRQSIEERIQKEEQEQQQQQQSVESEEQSINSNDMSSDEENEKKKQKLKGSLKKKRNLQKIENEQKQEMEIEEEYQIQEKSQSSKDQKQEENIGMFQTKRARIIDDDEEED